jgi:D-3-phosphoglycerate dehydrogenase
MKITLLEPIGIMPDVLTRIKTDLKAINHDFISFDTRPSNEDEIIKRIADSEVVIISNLPLSEKIINSCVNLKMISVAFAGVDHIPMSLCNQKQIIVSNAAGYSNYAVAELTIGSIISLYRKLNWCDQQTREGLSRNGFLGSELHGKTFGIIGLGEIGQQVAKLANAFGCKVLAYNRSTKDLLNIKQVALETLLKESDIVSLHVPLTDKTKSLIGKEELSLMKPSSILINTARGPIVNQVDLKLALQEETISGAAVDVYEKEPPLDANHVLFDAPNSILLPHIGYATKEAIKLRGEIVIDNINKWLEGNPQNIMN